MLRWHLPSVIWPTLLGWHFSTQQRLAFYCHDLPYESGAGFSGASQAYFGKQPGLLTPEQPAETVVLGVSPHENSPACDRFQAKKEQLLSLNASQP